MDDMQETQNRQRHLLTARQVQTMLDVDRSTVYRMAEDGRLPAIKVGRQWRFPAERITAFLDAGHRPLNGSASPASPANGTVPAAYGPSPSATAVVGLSAELLGVMMVVTDMDGRPVTPVANPCAWFSERASDPDLVAACAAEWQSMADDPDFESRLRTGSLGFQCARAFVRSGSTLVGMVLVGGVAPEGSDIAGLYSLDDEQRRRVVAFLPKVAAALSQVAPRDPRSTP